MTLLGRIVRGGGWLLLPLGAALFASRGRPAHADAATVAEKNERCAERVAVALLGRGATAEQLKSENPQASIDAMTADPRFVERFARFLNARFNARPGATPGEDASYYLAKYVLEKNLPYSDLFVGRYLVDYVPGQPDAVVKDDPGGLGYFRSPIWQRRYAGNELSGLKISTGYRIMHNTVGLRLQATTNAPDADITAKGREAPACRGCHFDNWFALDKAATVLTRRNIGDPMKFDPPSGGPQKVVDKTIADDAELVTSLVSSTNFDFNTCRTAFEYVYGRPESSCESKVFDACVAAFKEKKTMQAAVASVAKDPGFCQ